MNDPDNRRALRRELRARRQALAPAERIAATAALAQQLERLAAFREARSIAGYWAVSGELPLAGLVAPLRARGQRYLLPVLGPDQQLLFVPWQAGSVVAPNRYGIPEPVGADLERFEPARLDLVLVPLLGFDRDGHRLGFGGGWYDRSFAFRRGVAPPPLLVGIGFAIQELPRIEPAAWDVPLDYVATERALLSMPDDA
jgi:5-formyltetrahydrofolate cyclo-ligase